MGDPKDSLVEFQSSIFDTSDGHKLVDFIRKKKGLCTQRQKIFDDVNTDRQSLQIEIQHLDEDEPTLQPEQEAQPPEVADNLKEDAKNSSNSTKSTRNLSKSPSHLICKIKRLPRSSILRRTLLKDFERTLHESRFLPETCSTPVSLVSTSKAQTAATPAVAADGVNWSMAAGKSQRNKLTLKNVCSPITITDEDSPLNRSETHQNLEKNCNTEDLMHDLQIQNDLLEDLNNSNENPVDCAEAQSNLNDKENPSAWAIPLPHLAALDTTPKKSEPRRTYTIHRSLTPGNLILSPYKPSEQIARTPLSPHTPNKNSARVNSRRLVVTPEQRKILLSKFGLQSTAAQPPSVQKASRIPVILTGTQPRHQQQAQNLGVAHLPEHGETAHIIEQLQKNGQSNVPVIVIPVNQTFNQAPNSSGHVIERAPPPSVNSPSNSDKITSTTETPKAMPAPVEEATTNAVASPAQVENLRLEDIMTETDTSGDENSGTWPKGNNRKAPPRREQERPVREVIKTQQLRKMTNEDILDLRKRNSLGELRQSCLLSHRESSMLEKQVQLELLRRSIQREEDILPMEILPPPPVEFSDQRRSLRSKDSLSIAAATAVVPEDLLDESISDRVSLSQETTKLVQKKKKSRQTIKQVSEQLQKYLEASTRVAKSKYLNISKRKLYSKGDSDVSTSDDPSPNSSHERKKKLSHKRSTSSRNSKENRKSNKIDKSTAQRTTSSPPPPVSPAKVPQNLGEVDRFLPSDNEVFKKPRGRPPKKRPNPISSGPSDASSVSSNTSAPHCQSPNRMEVDRIPPSDNDEVFKKPKGKPPKKKPNTNSSAPGDTSSGSSKTSAPHRQYAKKKVENSAAPATAPDPVDPDNLGTVDSSNVEGGGVRRSKRGLKPLQNYWSCSTKEYIPLYDVNYMLAMKNERRKQRQKARMEKLNKDLPNNADNLVANTKNSKSKSVDAKTQRKKNSDEQREDGKPKQAKEKHRNGSNKSADTRSSNFPSTKDLAETMPAIEEEEGSHSSVLKARSTSKSTKSRKKDKKGKSQMSFESSRGISSENYLPLTPKAKENKSKNSNVQSDQDKEPSTHRSRSKNRRPLQTNQKSNPASQSSSSRQIERDKSTSRRRKISTDNQRDRSNSSSSSILSHQLDSDWCAPRHVNNKNKSKTGAAHKSRRGQSSTDSPSDSYMSPPLSRKSPTITSQQAKQSHFSPIQKKGKTKISQERASKSRTQLPSTDSQSSRVSEQTDEDQPTDCRARKSKASKSRKRLVSTDSQSDCVSENDPPSMQQVRLAPIAEISVSSINQMVAQGDGSRRSFDLMPPPKSTVIHKQLKRKVNTTNGDAFHADHDDSIAGVSPEVANNLFEQLKTSTMLNVSSTHVMPAQVVHTRQAEQQTTNNKPNITLKGCKKLAVKLSRSRLITSSTEKKSDSGFSSEELSNHPAQRGDILLDWLKQIIWNNKTPPNTEKGVAKLIESNGCFIARGADLQFNIIDGVEYAFYDSKKTQFGYMRVRPKAFKRRTQAKKYDLSFIVICGTLEITVNDNIQEFKNGDLLTIYKANTYSIKNNTNDPALVMVIRLN